MKKLITLMLCAVLTAALSFPAGALELRAGAKVPSSFAKIGDDGIVYTKKPTAYSPGTLNQILEAYGLKLEASSVGNTPAGYAKVNDGVISFGKKPTAYSPIKLHKIFKAYGLNLSPQDVSAALGSTTYASLSDEGQIVFGKKPTAYCGEHIATILGAYKLPMTQVDTPTEPGEIPTTPTEPTPIPTRTTDSDGDNIPDDQDVCPGTPPGARIDERGCWVLGEDYLFDFDKAVIKSQYYPILNDVARVMLDNPGLRVELEGHTDSTGPAKYNQRLSQRRANAVRTYLIKKGIEASRLTAVGYGEARPIASNKTREGRSKNRRVELTPIW